MEMFEGFEWFQKEWEVVESNAWIGKEDVVHNLSSVVF